MPRIRTIRIELARDELLYDLVANMPAEAAPGPTAFIAIGWDSSQTGFRKLFGDLSPFPVLAATLAFVPDTLLFPISFWSKAALADRIGYGGLRTALNDIFGSAYPEGRGHPDLYLLGHSFGTRVLSGLMQDRLALLPVEGEPFRSAPWVRGAAMIQPAAALPNLHRQADYPVLVTQSRHDHANGALFPLANLVANTYSFTSFEGIFRHRVLPVLSAPVGATADATVDATNRVTGLRIPDPTPEHPEQLWDPFGLDALRRPYDHAIFVLERGLAEGVSVPFALLYSAVTTPVNYVYGQMLGIVRNPLDHVMHTLAQLPLVEIPVHGLGRLIGRDVAWGARSKGFLELGLLSESAGRVFVEPWAAPRDLPVFSLQAFERLPTQDCGLPVCEGVFFVDASPIVRTGIFGASLERPLVDWTLGWLDPIGAHADYRNPAVVELMGRAVLTGPGGAGGAPRAGTAAP